MLSRTILVMSAAALAYAAGCSAKSTHPAATDPNSTAQTPRGGISGGGHGSSGTVDGGDLDGGVCNALSLVNVAVVTQQQAAEAVPVPIGGTIPDGTYILTKDTIYTGPGGTTGATSVTSQEIQAFSGSSVDVVSQAASPATPVYASGAYSLASITNDAGSSTGFTLTFSFTCPVLTAVARSYSVVNATILEFVGANEVLTYTLQP